MRLTIRMTGCCGLVLEFNQWQCKKGDTSLPARSGQVSWLRQARRCSLLSGYGSRQGDLLRGQAEAHPVGLPMILANALSDHKADSRWRGAADFVFSMPDGRPYSQEHLTKIALKQARERAGIPYEKSKTGFGLFRRSLATYLMKQTRLAQAQTQL